MQQPEPELELEPELGTPFAVLGLGPEDGGGSKLPPPLPSKTERDPQQEQSNESSLEIASQHDPPVNDSLLELFDKYDVDGTGAFGAAELTQLMLDLRYAPDVDYVQVRHTCSRVVDTYLRNVSFRLRNVSFMGITGRPQILAFIRTLSDKMCARCRS
jgi:hypothetical protein